MRERPLTGKKARITTAAQGIWRAGALACAAESARVIATDIDQAQLVDCGVTI